jgi:hypothetical protein
MFTIGIFTTHIPYIAFVVFYAFFLLFGVNKASSGEIQWSENNLVLKAPIGEELNNTGVADFSNYHYHAGKGIFLPGNAMLFVPKENIQHNSFFSDYIRQCFYSQALFSRPPPILS